MADVHRGVPGGEHRDVVLVELGDRLRVVGLELVVGDLVDPGAHRLAEQLAARLAADRVGDRADRVGGVDEAQGHRLRDDRSAPGRQNRRRKHPTSGFWRQALGPEPRPMLRAMAARADPADPRTRAARVRCSPDSGRRSAAGRCSSCPTGRRRRRVRARPLRGRAAPPSAARSPPSPALARELARALAVELGAAAHRPRSARRWSAPRSRRAAPRRLAPLRGSARLRAGARRA